MKPNKFLLKLSALTIVSIILLELNKSANADTNLIVNLNGDVKLKRQGNNEFQSASFLETLSYEDELQVSANSWVEIRCRNTDTPRIEQPGTYQVSNYCPPGESPDSLGNIDRIRDPKLTQTPYVISPRNSSVFPEEITIKWNRVAGASSYTVKIGDWQTKTTNTEIVYNGEPLTPGSYSVSVEANNSKSSGNVGFRVIDTKQAQSLRQEAEQIKQEGLDTEAETFILAQSYRSHKLKMLAIDLLENLVRSGSQNKNVYLLLANIYQEVGLESEAYETNQKAMEL